MHDFRSFVRLLDERGELTRINRAADPRFEIPALMAKLDQRGQAYLFEKVAGSDLPVVGGLFNRMSRFGLLFDADEPEAFTHHTLKGRLENAAANPLAAVEVDGSPARAVSRIGSNASLAELPVPTFFERDTGPFVTAGVGVIRDLESGVQNFGPYRTLIVDERTCSVNASSSSDLQRIYDQHATAGATMPVAIAVGVPPALHIAAVAKLPPNHAECDVAGALQGAPIELVRCETSDLLVPANAELVIEGEVDFAQKAENVMGEFPDLYGPRVMPLTRITAITRREDAMFYSILAGRNREHNNLGMIAVYGIRDMLTGAIRRDIPDAKDVCVHFDPRLGALTHVVISIEKRDDGMPEHILRQAFDISAGPLRLDKMAKRIIIVDDDIDVTDLADVEWATWTRVADPSRFILIPDVPTWELDRAADDQGRSVRVGIDATKAMRSRGKLERPVTPGAGELRLEDYLPQD